MTFAHVLTVLRRRWLTIVVAAIIGALLGLVVSALIPTRYSATTSLVVSPLVTNPFTNTRDDVNIRTEAEVLRSREVAERASEALGEPLTAGSYLLSQVDVAAPSGSQILQVTVQASTPEQAAEAADALSLAYLEFRREGAAEIAERYLATIDEQLAQLQADGSGSSATLVAVLQQQRLSVMLSSPEPGRIIGAATVPSRAATPGVAIAVIAGAAVGALGGVALALLRERLDRRVRAKDRLAALVGESLVDADSLDDLDAWDEVADRLRQSVDRLPEKATYRVLVDALGWPAGAPIGRALSAHLGTAIAEDEEGEQYAAFSARDISGRASNVEFTRAIRSSDVAVLLVSAQAELADVGDLLARLRRANVDVVVVYVAPQPDSRSRSSARPPVVSIIDLGHTETTSAGEQSQPTASAPSPDSHDDDPAGDDLAPAGTTKTPRSSKNR